MNEYMAELIGTYLLILLGCGVVANVVLTDTKGNNSGWIVITVGWGLAVFTGVAVAGPVSGAHINPAVTIGLAIAGLFEWTQVPFFLLAQMIGAILGAFTVWLFYRDHFERTNDSASVLGTFATIPQIRKPGSNFFSEAIGTFVLVFVILYIGEPTLELSNGEYGNIGLGTLGALPVALLVMVIGMALGGTTGYAINPARDLGPRIVHALAPISTKGSSEWNYSWIPVLGPITGSAFAALLFILHNSLFG